MGIYGIKSDKCDCRGFWSTLDSDCSVHISKPCVKHRLEVGNVIYYELIHILRHITKHSSSNVYKYKYPVKILEILDLHDIRKKVIKLELTHDNMIDVNQFDNNKQIYYSQLNDQPMWNKIDEHTIQFIILYNPKHYTIEGTWEPADY